MERFAKLFESHGRQILVKKGENSDGDNALCISTMFDGAEMSFNLGFGDNEEAMDHALESFTQEQADVFGKKFEGQTSAFEAFLALTNTNEDDE
ncbi:hypothetical protein [Leclercia adecarboxylata]|uniref:Uncharacterized protein n=1 Tax=Leclercia adecarboxylata TaxID=83655 RepID=A0A4U9I045_9ENTR|nr:hypothetical protein [Leclercia adecarboxylata]KFC98087.1 hypothetical protein GLAD_00741 [Leclercia adecarboxylata ATCC 23216 = NBRC 102595]PHH04977.1 hypothetical protein CRX53_13930 [Leclercia adecarboxylata]UBH68416.1 hypothetical protein LA332_03905 [Leclercia adecarboxylata]SPX64209.1 Uncharacterised protein [Leclercia adecarboxylata]STX23205.1 Uncharacterised protein [Leclercia adecarboxylata]